MFGCVKTLDSVADVFPNVTLNFEGNASMVLGPQDYLLQQGSAVSGSEPYKLIASSRNSAMNAFQTGGSCFLFWNKMETFGRLMILTY